MLTEPPIEPGTGEVSKELRELKLRIAVQGRTIRELEDRIYRLELTDERDSARYE